MEKASQDKREKNASYQPEMPDIFPIHPQYPPASHSPATEYLYNFSETDLSACYS